MASLNIAERRLPLDVRIQKMIGSRQVDLRVSTLPTQFAGQSRTFERYRTTELSDKQAHDLVIRFYDEHAVNVTDIPCLLREWREPRHPEFAQGGGKNAAELAGVVKNIPDMVKGRLT